MKATILVLCFCTSVLFGQAQQSISETDDAPWKFGFNLGANYSSLQSQTNGNASSGIVNGMGFRLGLLADYKISESASFIPKAELSFNGGSIEVGQPDGDTQPYEVLPVSMEFMTHMRFKIPGTNSSPYVLIGPKLAIPIPASDMSTTEFGSGYDLAIDLGIGLEKLLSSFSIAPELRYSYGLRNVNQNPSLQSVNHHNIALVLNFTD